jgi:hypothetical protein
MLIRGQGFSSHLGQFDLRKKYLYLLNGWLLGQTANLDTSKRQTYLTPISIQNSDRLPWPIPYLAMLSQLLQQISKYLNISCMTFQSHCIMGVTKSPWKYTWTTMHPQTVQCNEVTLKSYHTVWRNMDLKYFIWNYAAKRLHFPCIRKICSWQLTTAGF